MESVYLLVLDWGFEYETGGTQVVGAYRSMPTQPQIERVLLDSLPAGEKVERGPVSSEPGRCSAETWEDAHYDDGSEDAWRLGWMMTTVKVQAMPLLDPTFGDVEGESGGDALHLVTS